MVGCPPACPQLSHAAFKQAAQLESSSTGDCCRFDQPNAASVLLCLVVFEVADVDDDDEEEEEAEVCRCSSVSPPQPTAADQQQVASRRSLNRR